MNSQWLKPSIVFVVGIILGIGGMYLAGVRISPPVVTGVPNIANISGEGLAMLKDNKTVSNIDLRLNLLGIVDTIEDSQIALVNDDSFPIPINVSDQTEIIEVSKVGDPQPRTLKLEELKEGDVLNIFGSLSGKDIVADTIIRQL